MLSNPYKLIWFHG